jgi:hypothetical protein
VSAQLQNAPEGRTFSDDELPALIDQPDSRQILHVGYGAVLTDPRVARELRQVLAERNEEYASALAEHLGRHLRPFAAGTA